MKRIFFGLFLCCLFACQNEKPVVKVNVGDIIFDEKIDDPNFQLCNENLIKQYYVRYSSDKPSGYKGEKAAIVKLFSENYSCPNIEGEDGYVTIRFVVNCEGKPGRYRIQEMDFNYLPKKFEKSISEKLLTITKKLDGWIPVSRGEKNFDFYQYLTFRIEKGQIKKIMP